MSTQRDPDQFASSFCDWCPGEYGFATCLLSAKCPCVQFGYNAELLSPEELPSYMPYAGNCTKAALMYLGLMLAGPVLSCGYVPIGCQWILHMQLRQAVRRKYNLKPEPCNDCCTVFWCPSCSHCQEHHQLTSPYYTDIAAARLMARTKMAGSDKAPPIYTRVPGGVADGTPVVPPPTGHAPGVPTGFAQSPPLHKLEASVPPVTKEV